MGWRDRQVQPLSGGRRPQARRGRETFVRSEGADLNAIASETAALCASLPMGSSLSSAIEIWDAGSAASTVAASASTVWPLRVAILKFARVFGRARFCAPFSSADAHSERSANRCEIETGLLGPMVESHLYFREIALSARALADHLLANEGFDDIRH
jgi:hypothetical protein